MSDSLPSKEARWVSVRECFAVCTDFRQVLIGQEVSWGQSDCFQLYSFVMDKSEQEARDENSARPRPALQVQLNPLSFT